MKFVTILGLFCFTVAVNAGQRFDGTASSGVLPTVNGEMQIEDVYETKNLDILLKLLRRMKAVGVADHPPFDVLNIDTIDNITINNVDGVNGTASFTNVSVTGLGQYQFDYQQLRFKNLSIPDSKLFSVVVKYPKINFTGNILADLHTNAGEFAFDLSFSVNATGVSVNGSFGLEQTVNNGMFIYQIKSYYNEIIAIDYTISVKPHGPSGRSRGSNNYDDVVATIICEITKREINKILKYYATAQVDAFLNEPVLPNPSTTTTTTTTTKPTTTTKSIPTTTTKSKPTTTTKSKPTSPITDSSVHGVLSNVIAQSKDGILPDPAPTTQKDQVQTDNLKRFIAQLLHSTPVWPPFDPYYIDSITIPLSSPLHVALVTFKNLNIIGLSKVSKWRVELHNTDDYSVPKPKLLDFWATYDELSFESDVFVQVGDATNPALYDASATVKATAECVNNNGSLSIGLRLKETQTVIGEMEEFIDAFSIYTSVAPLKWSADNIKGVDWNLLLELLPSLLKDGPDEISKELMLRFRSDINNYLTKIPVDVIEEYLDLPE